MAVATAPAVAANRYCSITIIPSRFQWMRCCVFGRVLGRHFIGFALRPYTGAFDGDIVRQTNNRFELAEFRTSTIIGKAQLDAAVRALEEVAHGVHAHAAARHFRDLLGGRESRAED